MYFYKDQWENLYIYIYWQHTAALSAISRMTQFTTQLLESPVFMYYFPVKFSKWAENKTFRKCVKHMHFLKDLRAELTSQHIAADTVY